MYPNQFTRERLVAKRARDFEDRAARSRLADHAPVVGGRGRALSGGGASECRTQSGSLR
jgi:hypothetical protein